MYAHNKLATEEGPMFTAAKNSPEIRRPVLCFVFHRAAPFLVSLRKSVSLSHWTLQCLCFPKGNYENSLLYNHEQRTNSNLNSGRRQGLPRYVRPRRLGQTQGCLRIVLGSQDAGMMRGLGGHPLQPAPLPWGPAPQHPFLGGFGLDASSGRELSTFLDSLSLAGTT